MEEAHQQEPNRRDFIFVATITVGAIGAGLVAWPFIDQMRPVARGGLRHRHPLKAAPNGFEPTSAEARAALDSLVKDSYA